jgi:hypothetical protein
MMMIKPLKRKTLVTSKPTVGIKPSTKPSTSGESSEASELAMLRAKVAMLENKLKENANVAQVKGLPDGSDSSSEDEADLKSVIPAGRPPPSSNSSKPTQQQTPSSSDASGNPLKPKFRRASFSKDSAPSSSSKPSRSTSPEDLLDKHFPAPTLGAPRGGELGFVDMGRVPEVEKTVTLENKYGESTLTTMTPSSSNATLQRAIPEVGRVLPAGHKKGPIDDEEELVAGRRRFESQDSYTTLGR